MDLCRRLFGSYIVVTCIMTTTLQPYLFYIIFFGLTIFLDPLRVNEGFQHSMYILLYVLYSVSRVEGDVLTSFQEVCWLGLAHIDLFIGGLFSSLFKYLL